MNLSENRILTKSEVDRIHQMYLSGTLSFEGMHESIKRQLYEHVKQRHSKDLITINRLLLGNKGKDWKTLEYWKNCYPDFKQNEKLLSELLKPAQPVKTLSNGKTALDFTRARLEPIIKDIASMAPHESPAYYLNELLNEAKQFGNKILEYDFIITVHTLCREHSNLFTSQTHKLEITDWLQKNKSGITFDFSYNQTWSNTVKIEITTSQLALKCFYEDLTIKKGEQADKIARSYGFKNGNKLYNTFSRYSKRSERINLSDVATKTHYENRIKLLEKVTSLLADDKKPKALDELKLFKNKYKDDFL
jgi:hypothetical protein